MAQKIEIKNIIADPKVFRKGVERYKEKIVKNEKIKPLTVLKHPKKDMYAVLDGHHRFYAYMESDITEIECNVIKLPAFAFERIAQGWLQPNIFVTKNVRIPMKRFTGYIIQFGRYPERLMKLSRKPFIKLNPYTAKFEFDDRIPIKKRKELIKWFNSSIKKMRLDKDIDIIETKVNNLLKDIECNFEKPDKKVIVSFPDYILTKIDKKSIFHNVGCINEIIGGLKLEKTKEQPEIIQNAADEIVAMSVDGKLEDKNLPQLSKQERKKSFYEGFKKFKFKIDKEGLNKIVNRFWGKKVKTEKEIIKKAEEIVETLEQEKKKE